MQDESKISELILYLLDKYQRIAIKGIGTLYYEYRNASIDLEANIIAPPRKRLSLTSIEKEEVDLVDSALEEGLIDAKDASELKIYISLKALTFSRDDATSIPGLGTFRKSKGGLTLDTELSSKQVQDSLPEIELVIPSIETEASKDEEVLEKTNLSEKVIEKNPVANITERKESSTSEVSTKTTVKAKAKVNKVIAKNPSFLASYGWPLTFLLLGIILISLCFKTCFTSDPVQIINEDKSKLGSEYERAKDDIDPLATENEMFTSPNLNKYKGILTQKIIDEGCKIVVGTFDNVGNAQSLADQLREKDYKVDLAKKDNMNRVIITFNCEEYDLLDYFNRIRREVSDKAWYLSPQIEL